MVFLRSIFPLRYFFFKSHPKVKETVEGTKLDSVISYLDYVYAWNMTSVPSQPILGYHLCFRRVLWYRYPWTYFLLHGLTPAAFHVTVVAFHFSLSLFYIFQCKIYTETCVILCGRSSPFSHSPNSAHCLPAKIWLSYSFHFLLGITVFPREIEKQILGGKRGYMAKVKKVNKYELLS